MPAPQDRWARIEELFHQVLRLPVSQRLSWLDQACAGDAELRAAVVSLLEAEADDEAYLQPAIRGSIGKLTPPASGARVGPYELIREIGHGGMGTVYLAQRVEGDFRQNVALKLASPGADSSFVLSRFRHERRILAGLNHPNIARLYDGGADASGQPYFAMEYVEGRPLTEVAEQDHLSVRARINLFLEVCEAVEYAHQRMVIHRDLKPDNILVTAEGAPKLLDFGIAKLLDPAQTDAQAGASLALTRPEYRLMTPEYASPEQVRGEPVSAATDVYALGAVLFELLTRSKAQTVTVPTAVELDRVICQTDVVRPSTKAPEPIDRDLDYIVLKAMRKEPGQRYPSVSEMAADLRRWLEGLPVLARQGAWSYRAGKFLRRNRLGLAAAMLLVIAVAGGVISTVRQKRVAERRFQQVRNLANTFLFEVNDELRDLPGTTAVRKKLVDTAITYLSSLAPEAGGDPELTYEIARAYQRVGSIQASIDTGGLSRHREAIESWRRGAALIEGVARDRPRDARFQGLRSTLRLSIGRARETLGEPGAIDELRQALVLFQQTLQLDPQSSRTLSGIFATHNVIGDWELGMGRPSQALAGFEEALRIAREMVRANQQGWEMALVSAGIRIGDAQWTLGHLQEAETAYRDCLAVLASAPKNSRSAVEWRVAVTAQMTNLLATGRPYNLGRPQEVEAPLREAFAEVRGYMEKESQDRRFQELFLWAANPLSRLICDRHPAESLQLSRQALPVAIELKRQSPDNIDFQRLHAAMLEALSAAEVRAGLRDGATAHLLEALKLREAVVQRAPRAVHRLDLLLTRLDQAGLRGSSQELETARAEAERLAAEYPEYQPFTALAKPPAPKPGPKR